MSSNMTGPGASPPGLTLAENMQAEGDKSGADAAISTDTDKAMGDIGTSPADTLMKELQTPELRNPELSSDKKRKSTNDASPPSRSDSTKKVRTNMDRSEDTKKPSMSPVDRSKQLPAEIWQRIFTFLPPRALGRLLAVNKSFHTHLDPSHVIAPSSSCSPPGSSGLRALKPDAIWRASRRSFWPRMPAPLKGKSELDMWRLACSRCCQFCLFKGESWDTPEDQWHRGPGAKGVSFIIPFSVVACGKCLASKSLKEIDVLLSSTIPSVLLPALPLALMTKESHVVLASSVQDDLSQAPTMIKIFWRPQMDEISLEFNAVKALGPAAAEEWIKGLDNRGRQAMADASRWEKWDLSGGIGQMRADLSSPLGSHSSNLSSQQQSGQTTTTARSQKKHDVLGRPQQVIEIKGVPGLPKKADTAATPALPQSKQKRTVEELVKLRAKRRAEIERRALLLNPPISSKALAHIPSFQAALQVTTSLDDRAWELLKPRLLAQRDKAEKKEKESTANVRAMKERQGAPRDESSVTKVKAVTDKDWNDIQGPVRARILAYANEIIGKGWKNGERVTKKNCPQFAAEVLLYVRKRFYAEVTKDAAAAVAAGKEPIIDPPEGPWTQKLTLENMKWVFDTRIKPLTEHHRKELFLCNGCPGSQNKYFGIEGVIQHYAAKHTSALSRGGVVVHWRAEWPEKPPFNPEHRLEALRRKKQPSDSDLGDGHKPLSNPTCQAGPPSSYGVNNFGAPAFQYAYGYPMPYPVAYPYVPGGAPVYGVAQPSPYTQESTHQTHPPRPPCSPAFQNSGPYGSFTNQPPPAPPGSEVHASHAPTDNTPSAHQRKVRVDYMGRVAGEIWSKLSHVKTVPGVVKVCAIVHHTAKAIQNEFSGPATLKMLMDGLSTQKEMRNIRTFSSLTCKACVQDPHAPLEWKKFTFLQLVDHFQETHVEALESRGMHALDWRVDMVLLPDMSTLMELPRQLANHRAAYDVVQDTFPWVFDTRQPGQKPIESRAYYGVKREEQDHQHDPLNNQGRHGQDWSGAERTDKRAAEPTIANYGEPKGRQAPGPSVHQGPPSNSSHAVPAGEVQLRTASDVYGRAPSQHHPTRAPQPRHVQDDSRADRHDSLKDAQVKGPQAREHRETPPVHVENAHTPVEQPRNRCIPASRGDNVYDGHPRSISRHFSGESGSREDANSGSQWEDNYQPPARSPGGHASAALAMRPAEDGYGPPDAPEPQPNSTRTRVPYADLTARDSREARETSRYPPRDGRYGHEDTPPLHTPPLQGARRRSRSPRRDPYPPIHYRTRSPGPPEYMTRTEQPVRLYYDHPRAQSGPIVDRYELVEVRDPRGDYYIKRRIRPDEYDLPVYEARAPGRDAGRCPPGRSADVHQTARPGGYATDPRAPGMAPHHPPPPRMDGEEYDPRYPSAEGPSAGQGGP